jgi:hypothetical protein
MHLIGATVMEDVAVFGAEFDSLLGYSLIGFIGLERE